MSKIKEVRDAVLQELFYDPMIDASGIEVTTRGGHVVLSGSVPSYLQFRAAAAAAQRVAGVSAVQNNLTVMVLPDDYRDDATLTDAANRALALDVSLPEAVRASARNGVVTLTGTVNFGAQRDEAARTVGVLTGVRGIINQIAIENDADVASITTNVQNALDRHSLILDDSDIQIDTSMHTVTLSGHVRTWAEHDAVLDAAWMSPGVYDVRDELFVTG